MSRRILPAAIAAAAIFASVNGAGAGTATPIERDIYLIPGTFPEGQQPDGNSVVLLAPNGLVVIDTGRHATHTQQIVDFAQARRRPIAAIVNTHWHLDHTGGNLLLREKYPDVRIYASGALQDALRGFLKDYRQQLEQAITQAQENQDVAGWRSEIRLIDAGAKLAPDQPIDASSTLEIAGRKLAVHLEHNAATAGDVWLEDPATHVVISGDLVTLPVPFFDTACPTQWQSALSHIAAVPFKTLVPGHGKPMSPQQFEAYRHAFSALLSCSDSKQPNSVCAEQWLDNAGALIDPEDRSRVGPMLDYYMQAVLRAPASELAQRCAGGKS